MATRVNAPQVRSTLPSQQAATPAKAKEAAPTAQSAAVGWSAGAGKAASLKITQASIGDGPAITPKVVVPKGFKAEVKELAQKDSDKVHGKAVGLEQSAQVLTVTGPGGKKFSVGEGEASIKQYAADWKSEVSAAKKAPKEEFMQLDWDSSSSVSGAGTAGQLFSVSQGGSSYMGGAHPNNGTALSTFDARTGKQVKLDELISPKQMNDLVNDIAARLPKLKGPDDIGPESFGFVDDKAALRQAINENFAVSTDKSGKVKIDIAWESGVHALGGLMAHFSVEGPTDAGFKQKIGLE